MKLLRYVGVLFILTIGSVSVLAQADSEDDPTPKPDWSAQICDWGLLITERSPGPQAPAANITNPQNGGIVQSRSFTVEGTSGGEYRGSVQVDVIDQADGQVLAGNTVSMDSSGTWSADVDLGDVDTSKAVTVQASVLGRSALKMTHEIELRIVPESVARYVAITQPVGDRSVSTSPLTVEGVGGGAFEGNVVVQVLDERGGNVLAQQPTIVQTDEVGGSGPWSVEFDLALDPGRPFVVRAFQPSARAADEVEAEDYAAAIANPLIQRYDRVLVVKPGDPLLQADDVCAAARAEFNREVADRINVDQVQVGETSHVDGGALVTVQAGGPSRCPLPQRVRLSGDGDSYTGIMYFGAVPDGVQCSRDLRPFALAFPLGTQQPDQTSVTINGVSSGSSDSDSEEG